MTSSVMVGGKSTKDNKIKIFSIRHEKSNKHLFEES